MRILLLSIGTRGDVQPFLALGRSLQEAGHEAAICTSERFRTAAAELGLKHHFLTDGLLELLDSQASGQGLEGFGNLLSAAKRTFKLIPQTRKVQEDMLRQGWEAAQSSQPHAIVCHPKMIGGLQFAEKLGVPGILTLLFPVFHPYDDFPNPGLPELPLGTSLQRAYNRSSFRLISWLVSRASRSLLNNWRAANALPPLGSSFRVHRDPSGKPVPTLKAWSPRIVSSPEHTLTDTIETTGFWFLEQAAKWTPPPELAQFLADGPPPIYVGFGSMSGKNPKQKAARILEALRLTGSRAILASGWGALGETHPSRDLFVLKEAPHDWLFPRMEIIIHHGGAGTTARALKAAKPSIVCPFFGDQPFWGHRLEGLGVAPKSIPQRKLTTKRLSAAIAEVRSTPAFTKRANEIGKGINAEDGTRAACAFLLRLLSKPGRESV